MKNLKIPAGHVNWWAISPESPAPLRHQKYFLQSFGWGKKPSSSHLKAEKKLLKFFFYFHMWKDLEYFTTNYKPPPMSGVEGGSGVV